MRQEVNTVEEAEAIVGPLLAENKWAITVLQMPAGTFVVQWVEHKKYVAQDGQEFLDEIWTTREGELKLIQDLEPEHARNIIRMMIRNERESRESVREMFGQLLEQIAGDSEEDEEPLFPNWEPSTKPAGNLH